MRHSGAAAHMQHAEISPMLPQPHAACWSSAPQCTCTAQWVCKGALHCIRCGGASLRRGLTHRGAVSHRLNRRCGDPCIRLFHGATVPKSQCQSPCPPSFASRVVARYTMPAAWASQCQALCAPPVTCVRATSEPHAASNAGPQADTLVLQAPPTCPHRAGPMPASELSSSKPLPPWPAPSAARSGGVLRIHVAVPGQKYARQHHEDAKALARATQGRSGPSPTRTLPLRSLCDSGTLCRLPAAQEGDAGRGAVNLQGA